MSARPLEDLQIGEAIQYDLKDWIVKDRSVYRESVDYQEIQWTVYNKSEGECYLLRSEERKENAFEYIWVFTRPININVIECRMPSGEWESLKEDDFLALPPKELKLDSRIYTYSGETSGEARDDEGLTVTKLTWDYYDSSGARNLAIEVWKEKDRDYPEAYLGLVIEPYKVRILEKEKARHVRQTNIRFNPAIIGYAALVIWIACSSGLPFDAVVAISIPAVSLYILIVKYGLPWLYLASLSVWLLMAAFYAITDFGASYWMIVSAGTVIASSVARLTNLTLLKEENADYSLIAVTGLLPALWVYSFIMYYRFAPGPHTVVQLLISCILPVFGSGICYAVNYYLRNLYAQ